MKINRDQTPLSAEVVRNDQDFWDWYARRLRGSVKFRRDVVAQKSFSKLRSAIGGLYRSRSMFNEAENAFQQARILYPLSPEANFRLAQEVLVTVGRFAEARDLMEEFRREDPANTKIDDFIRQVDNLARLRERIGKFEGRMRDGKLEVGEALELAELYQQMGQVSLFTQIIMGIVDNKDLPAMYHFRAAQLLAQAHRENEAVRALDRCADRLPKEAPPEAHLEVARMYAAAQKGDKALVSLERYLQKKPSDWNGWLNLAALQIQMGRKDEASRSLEQAVREGGENVMQIIRSDKRFAAVYDEAMSRARNLMGLPGLVPPR
jgi:predicted Zn-dependent protease